MNFVAENEIMRSYFKLKKIVLLNHDLINVIDNSIHENAENSNNQQQIFYLCKKKI